MMAEHGSCMLLRQGFSPHILAWLLFSPRSRGEGEEEVLPKRLLGRARKGNEGQPGCSELYQMVFKQKTG